MTDLYRIDEYGRAVVNSEGLFELWFQGIDESGLSIIIDDEVAKFNNQCEHHGKDDQIVTTDTAKPLTHSQRVDQWMIPEECQKIDVLEWCLALCSDDEERNRVQHEMQLFEFYGMMPVLRALIHMISTFRQKKIVWGIGRGSSVASFVLYLIGVHKINPLVFGLDVEDFLR